MANIKDVAKKAGVGISTVSRVINDTKNVSPELRVKVERAIDELGYSTNQIARGLKISQTRNIAVIVTAISRIFFTTILEGINKTAEKYGYSIYISETNDSLETEIKLVRSYLSQWVDGIIIASVAYGDDKRAERYVAAMSKFNKKGARIPVITLEYPVDNEMIDAIVVDHEKAAYEAVSHLIDVGKRDIMHITVPLNTYMGQKRVEGYKRALKEHDIPLDETMIVEGDYTSHLGYKAVNRFLDAGRKFDGIFAANDQMAVGALRACNERGIILPDDVALIGNDNVFVSSIVEPSLSSIDVPRYEIGATAMERMHYLLTHGEKKEKKRKIITLDTKIVVRETTVKGERNNLKYLDW
jgi:glucose-resistance amylase regulator